MVNIRQKLLSLIFLIFLLFNGTSTSILYHIEQSDNNAILKQLILDQSTQLISLTQALQARLENICRDIMFVKATFENDYPHFDALESLLINFANANSLYFQIRYIDKTGQERIRINNQLGGATVVADDQLQDKSSYYYFKEAMALDNNQIYVSKNDLNKENGAISIPYIPTLRIATPVFIDQKKVGIVIINYEATMASTLLSNSNLNKYGEINLINDAGYPIASSNTNTRLYSFMFEETKDDSLFLQYPRLQREISSTTSNYFNDNQILFVYANIIPNPIIVENVAIPISIVTAESWYFMAITSTLHEDLFIPPNRFIYLNHLFTKHASLAFVVLFLNILSSILLGIMINRLIIRYHFSTHDDLTGAYTRAHGLKKAQKLYTNAMKKNVHFGMIYIDLNDLKLINDKEGHRFGDELLSILGYSVQYNIRLNKDSNPNKRNRDLFIRIGGDEFIILFYNSTLDQLEWIWKRIHQTFSEHKINNRSISASHGCIIIEKRDGLSFSDVIDQADALMYKEKTKLKKHRNQL